MSEYKIIPRGIGAHAKKLAANTVDTVVFEDRINYLEVRSNGAAAIYFTIGGTADPIVGGDHCFELPAQACVRVINCSGGWAESPQVKLISAGTPEYSVAREGL
jgi:hypothetical protein